MKLRQIMDEKYVDATNDIFAENAWYFRNSLVRANYKSDVGE